MLGPINLNYQFRLEGQKINDIFSNWPLPVKLHTKDLFAAQVFP
jgi:hypothetical protein